jgi:hypothetical protein
MEVLEVVQHGVAQLGRFPRDHLVGFALGDIRLRQPGLQRLQGVIVFELELIQGEGPRLIVDGDALLVRWQLAHLLDGGGRDQHPGFVFKLLALDLAPDVFLEFFNGVVPRFDVLLQVTRARLRLRRAGLGQRESLIAVDVDDERDQLVGRLKERELFLYKQTLISSDDRG